MDMRSECFSAQAAEGPVVMVKPTKGWPSLKLDEIWAYRELLYFLVWRDVKVRYKQTALGAAWAILQPLLTMVVFTFVFGRFARVPSNGLPYPLFSFTALLPWQYFASAMSNSSVSVVNNANLVSKVYFPRFIVPLASAIAPIVDFAIAFVILLGMMLFYGIIPTWRVATLPLFLLLAFITSVAVGLWLSALNVRYRDVGHIIPFLVQIWMFVSPIAYPSHLVPERWRLLYGLNPLAGVVEGFRWALLGNGQPPGMLVLASLAMVLLILVSGVCYFQRTEDTFADVI